MTFLDEVRDANPPGDDSCPIAKWLSTQNDVTDADLRGAAETVNVGSVHRALLNRGYGLGRQSVDRHIKGSCGCPSPDEEQS